jgi:class 3 adenylate cyclase
MDPQGRVMEMDPGAEALLGTSSRDAQGKSYEAVFGRSLAGRMVPLLMRVARADPEHRVQDVEATLPSGRRVSLRAALGPILDDAGALVGILFAANAPSDVSASDAVPITREQRYREAVRRYVGEHIASVLDERPSLIGVGGRRQVVTVMHIDARGYTSVAEQLDPESTADMLLRYHGAAVEALLAEGATFDRFIGDAVLAIWNAPRPRQDHARTALRSGLAVIAATERIGTEIGYGIGVNTGEAVVGNLGSETYMNYTAIGDTVNVAARLQSLATAGQLVCSRATLDVAGDGVDAEPLGEKTVKGRRGAIETFRVLAVA